VATSVNDLGGGAVVGGDAVVVAAGFVVGVVAGVRAADEAVSGS
jgi:hypothetical protein